MTDREKFWLRIHRVGESLGLTKHNLLKMEQRGYVPTKHHYEFLKTAEEIKVPLTFEELNRAEQPPTT